jgi:hypothetical protein
VALNYDPQRAGIGLKVLDFVSLSGKWPCFVLHCRHFD